MFARPAPAGNPARHDAADGRSLVDHDDGARRHAAQRALNARDRSAARRGLELERAAGADALVHARREG
eukprot:2351832-Prymnesium_polylepis.1